MDMTVNVKDFLDKMQKDLDVYTETYQKAIKAYQEKHEEYNEYLKKNLETITHDAVESLKNPPYMPHWDGKRFSDVIDALSAHTSETIKMTTEEYNNIRKAMERASLDIGTSFASMVNTIY